MHRAISLSLLIAVVYTSHAAAALRYQLTMLADPPELDHSRAISISEAGQIAGDSNGMTSLYWSSHDEMARVVTGVGADFSNASGVNSSGIVVGVTGEG